MWLVLQSHESQMRSSYTHAGPEIGVASTKAFTAQVTVLTLMAASLARKKESLTIPSIETCCLH